MRIGIGLTTYNRPECLKECLEHIIKYTDLEGRFNKREGLVLDADDIKIYIATDTDEDRRGVAYRKNECLRALKDCDCVFLFDDDCYPIKDGWVEFFINSGNSHLLFLNHTHNFLFKDGERLKYRDCGGVFMFMTKECIEKVGAFNEKFTPYGFEHADWSNRAYSWYGYKHGGYYMLEGTEQYIFAHDYSTSRHKSSITDEEKLKCVKNNWNKFFNSEIKDVYLPL